MSFEKLENLFAQYQPCKIVIVGLGNAACSDDIAGLLVWEKLKNQQALSGATFINAGCNPENYLMQIITNDPDLVLFTDAVEDRNNPGIKLYNSNEIDDKDFSTHAYSIGFIEKFLKMNIDCEIKYLGISIQNSYPGAKVTDNIVNQINNYF